MKDLESAVIYRTKITVKIFCFLLIFAFISILHLSVSGIVNARKNDSDYNSPAEKTDNQTSHSGAANKITVPLFDSAPVIDGVLNDSVWKNAALLKDFYQVYPGDNTQPGDTTEVLIGYDAQNLYIGIHAFEKPDKIRATVAKRDAITNDDYCAVYLDTFNDHQKAYLLMFNPLGIQQDGIYTESAGADYSFDLQLNSKGTVTGDGYVIEAAIPFRSLRYQPNQVKNWGIHVKRFIKYNNNEEDSLVPITRGKTNFLEQAAHLVGLDKIAAERTVEITPSVNFSESGKRLRFFPQFASVPNPTFPDAGHFVNQPFKTSLGLTLKANLTPNLVLDATVNPDFAQVEADQLVVTANQRFPILFEEKRPFFLEGAEIFKTPISAVYTRAIIDPDWAVKLSGKESRISFGLLVASDNAPGDYSDEELADPVFRQSVEKFIDKNALVGVLRVKRDVGKQSSVGLIATSYDFVEKHNHTLGFDGRFNLNSQTVFKFQAICTDSKKLFYDPEINKNIYRMGNGIGYLAQLERTGRHFNWSLNAVGRSPFYRTDVGFVSQTNVNFLYANLRYNSEPNPNGKLVSWSLANTFLMNFDWQGRMKYAYVNPSVALNFKRQTHLNLTVYKDYLKLLEEEFGARRTATQAGAFFGAPQRSTAYPGFTLEFGTTPSKKYSAAVSINRTWNVFDYDFGAGHRFPRVSPAALLNPNALLDPGLGKRFDITTNFDWQPTDNLKFSFNYTKSKLLRKDTNRLAYNQNLPSLRATYQFSRSTFARVRMDYDSLQSRIQEQFLVGWTPHPGTAFYAGYDNNLNYNGFNPFTGQYEPRLRQNGQTFFVKLSWLFRHSF